VDFTVPIQLATADTGLSTLHMQSYQVGRKARYVFIPIVPGGAPLKLHLRLIAGDLSFNRTLIIYARRAAVTS
jgi:hypothetical protein